MKEVTKLMSTNIVISMISNNLKYVERWFRLNSKSIIKYNENNSIKSNISVLVNWNSISDDKYDKAKSLKTYGVPYICCRIDPLIRNNRYHWNTSRFSNLNKINYDYLHLVDDDMAFVIKDLSILYDYIIKNKLDFVQVTSNKVNLDDTDEIFYKSIKSISYKKSDILSDVHKVLSGGHIFSKLFIDKHIDELTSYDEFNDDTYRCYIALKYNTCYHTSRRVCYSNYISAHYNLEDKLRSVYRFQELGIPISINLFSSIKPLIPNEVDKLVEELPGVYVLPKYVGRISLIKRLKERISQ